MVGPARQESGTSSPYSRDMITVSASSAVIDGALVSDAWIQIEDADITGHGSGSVPLGGTVARVEGTVVPGFVDQHCHGGAQGDFFAADEQAALTAAAIHLRHGTTTQVASLVTATHEALMQQIGALVPLVADGVLAGIHLEGPWLSRDRCGAHDPQLLRPPSPTEIEELLAVGDGHIVMATLAPELPGAQAAIRQLVSEGVVAAVGHTGCTAEQAREAIAAGATVATHLFNQMPGIHKRDGGVVVALLDDPRVTVELIADGVHVDPAVIRFAVNAVGPARVAAVTDAMGAAGAPDGRYLIGALEVDVVDGVATLAGGGPLAGSTLTMDRAFRTLVSDCGLDLADASAVTATTPARAMGFTDRGSLQPGMRADLVVLDHRLEVSRVMRAGQWVD